MVSQEVEMKKKTTHQRITEAKERHDRWLAMGNSFAKKGMKKRAQFCYDKAEWWGLVAKQLVGRG